MGAFPFQPALPYLIDELHALIDGDLQPPHADELVTRRNAIAATVIALPATCREARALVKLDERRWAWLCAFEYFRTNSGVHLRLFDGLPSCIQDLRTASPGTRPIDNPHPEDARIGVVSDLSLIHI